MNIVSMIDEATLIDELEIFTLWEFLNISILEDEDPDKYFR